MKSRPVPLAILALTLLVPTAIGQKKISQAELRSLRTAKLAKPIFTKSGWTFDYDKARARARREGKPILAYFTRSYAP